MSIRGLGACFSREISGIALPLPLGIVVEMLIIVRRMRVVCCDRVSYSEICEGCESKKSKICMCARVRVREKACFKERSPSHLPLAVQ